MTASVFASEDIPRAKVWILGGRMDVFFWMNDANACHYRKLFKSYPSHSILSSSTRIRRGPIICKLFISVKYHWPKCAGMGRIALRCRKDLSKDLTR